MFAEAVNVTVNGLKPQKLDSTYSFKINMFRRGHSVAGSRNIEDFKVGELVLSRNEYDSTAPIEIKVVEEVFVRLAPILSIHVHGQVINTTGEHPFYVENKGWIDGYPLRISLIQANGKPSII
ncbi:MAG: polymorphic toxin-type HINT domain-containing protein [Zavarzinella sp.]